MAEFPTLAAEDVALFAGRPAESYSDYVTEALKQATTLFRMATCLKNFPDDDFEAELARNAILSMADALYLSQPFQKALANPFQSETIGSYSYSKVSGAIMTGVPLGIFWFDSAVQRLGVCDLDGSGIIGGGSSGGIEMFEHQGTFIPGTNNPRFVGPADAEYYGPRYGSPD